MIEAPKTDQNSPQPSAEEVRRALTESADLRDLAERVRVAKLITENKKRSDKGPRKTGP